MLQTTIYIEDEEGDHEYELEVEWNMFGHNEPAKTYGPPENCYPAQYAEVDDVTILLHEFGRIYVLNNDEVHELYTGCLEEELHELAGEQAADEYEAHQEAKYDEWKDSQWDRD